jgi:threonine aldolase
MAGSPMHAAARAGVETRSGRGGRRSGMRRADATVEPPLAAERPTQRRLSCREPAARSAASVPGTRATIQRIEPRVAENSRKINLCRINVKQNLARKAPCSSVIVRDVPPPLIDLRSDTVTRPTPGMRAAMAAAPVGDDVYGDDPTVNRLQTVLAERFGFASALFFPTGTQSNLAALMAHCNRGDEYLVGQDAHTYKYEQGGAAVLGSIQPQPLENEPDGSIAIERIERAIKPADVHFAPTRLLALENTMGGRVLPLAYLRAVTGYAHGRGLRTHLDGARLFNAIVKLGIDEPAAVAGFDSVSLCLSKGLGAPAGSVLLGSAETIAAARRWRKALGGGMRQAGILAAAGLYALEHHVHRLSEDHENAEFLAAGLRGIGLVVEQPQTNIVFVDVPGDHVTALGRHLAERGVLATISRRTRLATHLDAPRRDLEAALEAIREYPGWRA